MILTYGSLFAGIGGFDLAADRAGMRCLWQVEIDPAAQSVLQRHWPDVPKFADVRECGAHNLTPVDVVTFGSPCQDLSVAGKRGGLDGERSGLFFEAIRIIRDLRPTYAVWENVPGAFSSNGGRDFGAVLDALADAGALDIAWGVLDAQWFGVAQRRRRVFVVADFRGERAGEILSVPYGLSGDTPPRREAREGTTGALEARVRAGGESRRMIPAADTAPALRQSGRGVSRTGESRGQDPVIAIMTELAAPLVARQAKGPFTDPENDNIIVISQNGSDVQTNDKPGAFTSAYERGTSGPVLAFDWQSGGDVRLNVSAERTSALQANQTPAVAFEKRIARNGRGAPSEIVPPLKAQSGGSGKGDAAPLVAAFGVRRLTPTEAERLQGFPDGHTAGQSDSARYRQLGNAVAVPVAEWIMRRIAATEDSCAAG